MWFCRVSESNDARLQALWNVVQQLPQSNLDNLRYLVKFLALLSQNQEVNSIIVFIIVIVLHYCIIVLLFIVTASLVQ